LEQEEQKRQNIQLDKIKLEERLKRDEERIAEIEDANDRLLKERKQMEERVKQLSDQLVEEEENAKQVLFMGFENYWFTSF
jgi:hypothetical protein